MLERASGPFLLAYMLPALASSRSQLLHSPRVCHNRGDQNKSEAHLSVERWSAKRKCGPRQQQSVARPRASIPASAQRWCRDARCQPRPCRRLR
jgi:hypothetical protein